MNNIKKEEIMNIVDVSHYLKCSVSTIRNMIKNHDIPYFRIGVKYYFRLTSIEEWVSKNEKRN
ncbi:MAG: helix-turn-helix domain-containing protein [Firmicutes bacterium]|nr:helix-turn-helix domain-containing protein [Bacillota bacterium]